MNYFQNIRLQPKQQWDLLAHTVCSWICEMCTPPLHFTFNATGINTHGKAACHVFGSTSRWPREMQDHRINQMFAWEVCVSNRCSFKNLLLTNTFLMTRVTEIHCCVHSAVVCPWTVITVWFGLRQFTGVQILVDGLLRGEQVLLKESNIITINDSLSLRGERFRNTANICIKEGKPILMQTLTVM